MTELIFRDEVYAIIGKDTAQLLNYLKATGSRVGLLINFGNAEKLEWERRVK